MALAASMVATYAGETTTPIDANAAIIAVQVCPVSAMSLIKVFTSSVFMSILLAIT